MPTLYRTYRPQDFAEILGQNYIKTIIQNEILTNKIAQAYLFCGPRAVGKTTMARVFAKAVNCLDRKENEFEPCNKCENCLNINAGRNLDIIEIDAASNTGVDNVRENIISASRIGSNQNRFKVFIIDEVHMLSISAFNALLKVIEEPPAHVIFILCTTEIHKVPATIISRCQRFDFKRISVADMVKKLERIVKLEDIKIEKGILESIARHADGYLRDAESLLGQIISIGGQNITQAEADLVIPHSDFNEIISLLEYLARRDSGKAIKLINNLVDDGISLKNFLTDLIEVLRKIMLTKINPALAESLGLDFGEALEMKLNTLVDSLTLPQLVRYIEKFNAVNNELKNNFIIQLPVELAIIDLCLSVQNMYTAQPTSSNATPAQSISTNATLTRPTIAATKIESPKVKDEPLKIKDNISKADNAKPKSESEVFGSTSLSLDLIKNKWSEVLIQVKPFNHSLSFVLQSGEISSLNGRNLTLTFKYKFHKDLVHQIAIKDALEKILADVYGASLIIEAVVDENLELKPLTTINPEAKADAGRIGNTTTIEASPADLDAGNTTASQAAASNSNNIINNILKTFGGEIVS